MKRRFDLSGSGMNGALAFIGLDNSLNKLMPDNIFRSELDDADAFNLLKQLYGFRQTALCPVRKIGLRKIARNNHT